MYVQVDMDQDLVYLADVGDAHRLSVLISGTEDLKPADEVLGEAGSIDPDDPDHAWLDVGWVRMKGAATAGGAWGERFDELLAKAGREGLLNEDRTLVRAPVEWSEGEELGKEID